MIEESLRKLEERIRAATDDASRDELLALVADLRSELGAIADTDASEAADLARHTHDVATGEVDADGVEERMLEFETAHPKTVGLVRALLRTLSDAGI